MTSVTLDILRGEAVLVDAYALAQNPGTGEWNGLLTGLPVGVVLDFSAHAYNFELTEIFAGSAQMVLANGDNNLVLSLAPVNNPPMALPQIVSVTMPDQVLPGSETQVGIGLAGSANDTLSWAITAAPAGGSFEPAGGNITLSAAGAATVWVTYTAPTETGTYAQSVLVTNGQGNSVQAEFAIHVLEAVGGLRVQFYPVVTSISASRAGNTVTFLANAADDGSIVAYQWNALLVGGDSPAFAEPGDTNPAYLERYDQTVYGTVALQVIDDVGLATVVQIPLPLGQFPDDLLQPAENRVLFHVTDTNYTSLAGVALYVDDGNTPVAMTDSDGQVTLALTGIHSVHIYKANYRVRSIIGRDWTGISFTEPALVPSIFPATNASVSGVIEPTIALGGSMAVRARRLTDGVTLFGDGGSVTTYLGQSDESTPYSIGAREGYNVVSVFPRYIDIAPADSFAGLVGSVPVSGTTTGVDIALTWGSGIGFTVSAENGFTGGRISVNYSVFDNPYQMTALASVSSVAVIGASVGDTAVTIPPFHLLASGLKYSLGATAYSGTSGTVNQQYRSWARTIQSYSDLLAELAAQHIVLPFHGVDPIAPLHGATDTGTRPVFSWTVSGSPECVEVDVYRLSDYQYVWQALVYGASSATLPAFMTDLNADTAYFYDVQGRDNLPGVGGHGGFAKDGWTGILFSTGPTPPP